MSDRRGGGDEREDEDVLDELRPEVNQSRVADALPGEDAGRDEPDGTEVTGQAG